MASFRVSSRDDGSTQIDMNKCKACPLCNTSHSNTEETDCCKKRLGDAFSKQQAIERQTSDDSMFAESNIFMLKAIILWAIICLPGNVFAFVLIYQKGHHIQATELAYENTSYLQNHEPVPFQVSRPITIKQFVRSS